MHKILRSRSVASSMLSHSGRGNPTMNSKRGLMTVLVGLAMLATPIAAAAKDHGRFDNSHARYVAPVVGTRHEFRNGATWMPAPAVVGRRDWHHGWDANAYRNYGN